MNKNYQLLMLIATPKLAEKAADLFLQQDLPVQYRLNAKGTASSEIMDTLGFGSIDKRILLSMVPRTIGNRLLNLLHTKLRLDAVNSGIAFTIPLTGASKLLVRMMQSTEQQRENSQKEKGEHLMAENQYTLIAVMVDRGFSGDVMEAAKAAGAGGGTVVTGRGIEKEETTNFWGLSVQEEKELVLILADYENRVQIMSTIGEKCGMHSEAKGLVFSLPIDSVMGL